MSSPYIGEIRMFAGNFAPAGWMTCDGQTLPISENDTLFQLIGTTYGSDGQQTFALPKLTGSLPVHMGHAPSGTNYQIGASGGVTSVTLTTNQLPSHTHPLIAFASGTSVTSPANAYPGTAVGGPNPML